MIKNFDEIISKVQANPVKKRVVVAAAHDSHAIEAVAIAQKAGICDPVLVGTKKEINKYATEYDLTISSENIYNTESDEESAATAVKLVNEGKGDFLMKGKISTGKLLKAVVNKETGLNKGTLMSHLVLNELPTYHKLLASTDGGMMMYPTVDQKKQIVENAVDILHKLGYEKPKVAAVAAVEVVNPKMPETVEAKELDDMNIEGCTVAGPISLDIALNKEIADIKGYDNEVAGDADVILVPNIQVGNIFGKSMTVLAKAKMAGIIVGAKCPIVLTSRGSSAEEKYLSIVLAAATAV